jgi:amidase
MQVNGEIPGTKTASEIAAAIHALEPDPVAVTQEALDRIAHLNNSFGAFRPARGREALAEAAVLRGLTNLTHLPLAGAPIRVKGPTAVAGETPIWCSGQLAGPPFCRASDITVRLRAAGPVIVGLAPALELCLWPMTDTTEAIIRNPSAPKFTARAPSGGSATAVAAGMVPLTYGTDAFGSVRSAATICGLVGVPMPGEDGLCDAIPTVRHTSYLEPSDLAGSPAMSVRTRQHPSEISIESVSKVTVSRTTASSRWLLKPSAARDPGHVR